MSKTEKNKFFNIQSETAPLKAVIVHTPGEEVSLVNPELKEELLFDDIIYESDARQEHLDMLEIIKTVSGGCVQIFEICDLAKEAFQKEEAREYFVEKLIRQHPETNMNPYKKDLCSLPPASLIEFAVTGRTANIPSLILHPSPNLVFTRDLASIINDQLILSQAARKARRREFLFMEAIVHFHPHFRTIKDNIVHFDRHGSLEGGDILVVSSNVIMVGISERSSFSGLMSLMEPLFLNGIEHVIAVDLPKQRASMHLDTIFTFASPSECVIFPPAITGLSHHITHFSCVSGRITVKRRNGLKEVLEELTGRPFTFIPCGGNDLTNQYREQWTDGANLFALAPGVVLGYERNRETFKELERHGYHIIPREDFFKIFGKESPISLKGEKFALMFQGNELCRGRGGARCMTLPLLREEA